MRNASAAVVAVVAASMIVSGAGDVAAQAPPSASALPAIAAPVRFGDTFDNGRRDGWTVMSETRAAGPARWRVVKGSLRQTKNVFTGTTTTSARPGTQIVAGNPAWSDYDFAVTARSSDKYTLGVVFRFVDANNFYRFTIDRHRGLQQLVAKIGGRYRVLAQSRGTFGKNKRYRLRVHAVGADLRALIDGRQVLAAHDSRLPHGRFGMYTRGAPARFDNVSASIASPGSFTIAVLPDTQYESASSPAMFQAQTSWLARNRATQNIVAALHEGDVVDRLQSKPQWRNARAALNYVAGKIPLTVAAGNHDIQKQHRSNPRKTYGKPFQKMVSSLPNYRVAGSFGSLRDTYQLLDAGGVRFVIVNLSYGPSDAELQWAGQVADQYGDRHVILLTHDYLGQDGQRRGLPTDANLPSACGVTHNDGIGVWDKFVRIHRNVQFTFNGHVITPTVPGGTYSAGRLVDPDDAGNPVYQVLANYQTALHGGGYLRLVRFYPAEHRVTYETYSPYLRQSLTDADNQFAFTDVDLH